MKKILFAFLFAIFAFSFSYGQVSVEVVYERNNGSVTTDNFNENNSTIEIVGRPEDYASIKCTFTYEWGVEPLLQSAEILPESGKKNVFSLDGPSAPSPKYEKTYDLIIDNDLPYGEYTDRIEVTYGNSQPPYKTAYFYLLINIKAPEINIFPDTLDFGTIWETGSYEKIVTITNTGETDFVEVDGWDLERSNETNFSVTSTTLTIPRGESIDIIVRLDPRNTNKLGAEENRLVIWYNGYANSKQVTLMADVKKPDLPDLVVVPLSWEFKPANQLTTDKKDFILEHTGLNSQSPITITEIKVKDTATFVVNYSGNTIPARVAKIVNVTFQPNKVGKFLDTLQILSTDTLSSVIKIPLSGEGKGENKLEITSPENEEIDFGSLITGKDTTITIKNSGDFNIEVEKSFRGQNANLFSFVENAGTSLLSPGKVENIKIRIDLTKISSGGLKTAELVFTNNIDNKELSVISLKANILAPRLERSPYSIIFPDTITVGSSSEEFSIVVSNSGDANLLIEEIKLTGGFPENFSYRIVEGEQYKYPIPIAPQLQQRLEVKVKYSPKEYRDTHFATCSITTSNNPDSITVGVTLFGHSKQGEVTDEPKIAIEPTSINFYNVNVDTEKINSIIITNTGTANLVISTLNFTGADAGLFTFDPTTHSLPLTILPLANTTLTIKFLPNTTGSKVARLEIGHNASGSPNIINLTGTGVIVVPLVPDISVDLSSVDFDTTHINTGKSIAIRITNTGTANLVISTLNFTGADAGLFTVDPTTTSLPLTILPLANTTLMIKFLPTTTGSKVAQLEMGHNASGSPNIINLTGTGVAAPVTVVGPQIKMNDTEINFDDVDIGSDLVKFIEIENIGDKLLTVEPAITSGNNCFRITSNKNPDRSLTINPGEKDTLYVQFIPENSGPYIDKVALTHDATNTNDFPNPFDIKLTGTGVTVNPPHPPVSVSIDNGTKDIVDEGNDAEISVVVSITTGQGSINDVIAYHRVGGVTTGDYRSTSLRGSGSYYTGEVKIDDLKKGLDYYIGVMVDNELRYDTANGGYKNNPKSIKVRLTKPQKPTDDVAPKAGTYSLMSLPFDLESGRSAIELLQDDNNLGTPTVYSWRLFAYDGGYKEYTTERFKIGNGEGFWFIHKDKIDLNFSDVLTNRTNKDFIIELKHGWNIIGNPFLFNVAIPEAVGNDFDGLLYEYIGQDLPYTTDVKYLKPYKGYFVYNNNTATVNIYIKPIEINPNSSLNKIVPNTFSADEWKMNILLDDGKKVRDEVEIGAISPDSKNFVYHKPPPSPGGGVDMYLVSSGKAFARYYYNTNENNMVWDLRIKGLKKSSTYSLSLKKNGNLDNVDEFVIIDVEMGDKINVVSNTIHIPSGYTEKMYKIIVGKKQFVQDELYNIETSSYKLHQNYPNPFNPSTNIEYVISENSYVTVKVYNALGQEVSVLVDGIKEKGIYNVTWNAVNQPSGIYYYKLTAGNYVNVKKMMLMK
jgi:hypothetical protein